VDGGYPRLLGAHFSGAAALLEQRRQQGKIEIVFFALFPFFFAAVYFSPFFACVFLFDCESFPFLL
jgi:hypothetical protein